MKKPLIYLIWLFVVTGTLLAMQRLVSPEAGLKLRLEPSSRKLAPSQQRILPSPKPNPDRAPQSDINKALFSSVEFFGSPSTIARPTREARANLARLIEEYPRDSRLRLMAAQLDVRLGRFDRAGDQMHEYAELEGRQPRALKTLAVFYDSRAQFADEIRTLMELARRSPEQHRSAIYRRVITLMRDHQPGDLDLDQLYRQMIEANPKDFQLVQNYIEDLRAHHRDDRALAVIHEFRSRFPRNRYLLRTEAHIHLRNHHVDAALRVYEPVFDPLWPPSLAADYYALLKRVDRYRRYRRQWRQAYDAGTADFQTIAQLFSLYVAEGNLAEANRVLEGYEKQKASQQPATGPSQLWPAAELETLGAMYASIGNYDQASRYYYTLYLTGIFESDTARREEALQRLFQAFIQAQNRPTRMSPGDLSLYRDIAAVDQSPGLLNGVLSLILANTEIPKQFKQREARARRLFNALLAYRVFEAFKSDYPNSDHLPQMVLAMIDTFTQFKRYALAVELGRQFLTRHPDSSAFEPVSLKIAQAYRALENYREERHIYRTLLDRLAAKRPADEPLMPRRLPPWRFTPSPRWAAPSAQQQQTTSYQSYRYPWNAYPGRSYTASAQEVTYKSVLDRAIASLSSTNDRRGILRLYWSEIQKHPREEGLYEAFLRWLDQTNLFNDKLRAYQEAIRHFRTTAWYDRLARWLVRERRASMFRQVAQEIVEILDEEELSQYLGRFITYSGRFRGRINYDRQLTLRLYQFAHDRFPHNLTFVHWLLDYYKARRNWAAWEPLAREYYFADPTIRDDLLRRWSKTGILKDRHRQARRLATTSTAYRWFAADAAMWLCRYEEAVDTYTRLLESYPGEPAYGERLATLLRSLGQKDEKNFVRAAIVWAHLAEIYPTHHQYRTKAGEAYADDGDPQAASQQWDEIVALESGRRQTYLEVASIYWDYFMYDDAIGVLQSLRDRFHDETLYAYQMGALYEGKRDDQAAIREYVKALAEPGLGRQPAVQRLSHLARQRQLREVIQRAYSRYAETHPDQWQLAIGYEQYLHDLGAHGEAWRFLQREADQRRQEEFLLYARNRFYEGRRIEAEGAALRRLVAIAGTEIDDMKYRLQLASYLEKQGQAEQAAQIVEALVARYPTNYGVLDEATRFFWRVGRRDRSIALYRAMIQRARGGYVRAFKLALARRLAKAHRFDESERLLRALYAENSTDTEVFSQLAQVLSQAGRLDDVLELYRTGIANMRKRPLTRRARRDRIAELRRAMIDVDTQLGKYTEALDQHIEIINRDATNRSVVTAAMDYATRHKLTNRIIEYYQKTAEKSNLDYRWNQVLAWVYEYQGQPEAAAEQYRLAVQNEPQRLDLRSAYADALIRINRYAEAIAQLQRGYELSGEAPEWQVKIAQASARQGDHQRALAALNKALSSTQINSQNIFAYAQMLESWGLSEDAREFYLAGFERMMKDFYTEPLIDNRQFAGLVRTSLRTGAAQAMLDRLLKTRQWAQREARREGNLQAWRAQQFQTQIETMLRESFARNLARFGEPQELAQVMETLRRHIASLTEYTARSDLKLFATLAHNARFADLEERILKQLVDAAFRARVNRHDTRCYGELRNLLHFYNDRGAFAQAAAVLRHYDERDPFRGLFNYREQIARQYRWAGDTENELAMLRQIYRSKSGKLTEVKNELVERYFSLLHQEGHRRELSNLARTINPYQLQLVNFLLAHREQELALTALEHTGMPPAWIDSRQAQVGTYFKDISRRVGQKFRSSLRLRPIGDLIAAKPDANLVLVGDDWYRTARVYGLWLDLKPADESESRDYITALIEHHPRRAWDQLELAKYYLGKQRLSLALDHAELAAELAPKDLRVMTALGDTEWAQGREQDAQATWARMISDHPMSAPAHRAYLDVLKQHGLEQRALEPIRKFLVRSINASGFNQAKPLVRRIAEVFDTDTVAALFEAVVAAAPSDVGLARMVIEEKLLPGQRLTPLYRAIVAYYREGRAAQAPASTRQSGYQGQLQASPAEYWQQQLIEHLIDQGHLAAAREEITAFKKTLDIGARPPGWLRLDEAKLDLRLGQRQQAIERLRRFATSGSGLSARPQMERVLRAAALLRAEGLRREANEFLREMYSQLLTGGAVSDAYFVGLAEALFSLGRDKEALDTLDRMVNRAVDPYKALPLAGEVAFRYKQFAQAAQFRSRLMSINPEAMENRLELARAQAARGDARAAGDTVAALLRERKTPSELAAMAVELVPELAKGRTQQALGQLSASAPKLSLARAALLRRAGQLGEARRLLESLTKDRTNVLAWIERALLEQRAGHRQEQARAWEEALFIDPEEVIAENIIFAANAPRAQLIGLYAQMKRYEAALQIVEGQPEFAPAPEWAARRYGRGYSPHQTGEGNDRGQLKTMKQRNASAKVRERIEALATLAQAAKELGEYDRALGYLRAQLALLGQESAIAAAKQSMAELKTEKEQRDRQARQRMSITKHEVHLGKVG